MSKVRITIWLLILKKPIMQLLCRRKHLHQLLLVSPTLVDKINNDFIVYGLHPTNKKEITRLEKIIKTKFTTL